MVHRSVILNKPKVIRKSLMKTTHSLEQVEALMWKESNILRDPNVGKEAKQKARKKLRLLEKHFADCNGKEFNGKKYPLKVKPVEISKKDLIALIDSVEDGIDYTKPEYELGRKYYTDKINKRLDVTGVFIYNKEK